MTARIRTQPYWWDALASPQDKALPAEAELVIVGGGFTGLAAALTASRAGVETVLLDARTLGFGASTRNGGICSGQLRSSHAQLSKRYGRPFADAAYAEGVLAREDLIRFCKAENLSCDLHITGRFTGAMSPRDYDRQAREAERLNTIPGHRVRMIPRALQHQEIASDLFHGGMLREEIGGYHPGKFYQALLRITGTAGAQLHPQTPVLSMDAASTGHILTTPRGDIKAGKVIVATNGYTGLHPFDGFLRRRLVPVQSAIIVTEPLGVQRVQSLMPALRMYGNTAKLFVYFRPTPDHTRILLGSRSLTTRPTPSLRTIESLRHTLQTIFPQLTCDLEYAWLGNVAFSRTALPSIFHHKNIAYAVGYCGSGTVWARWLGHKVAQQVLGLTDAPSVFTRPPPPAVPLYNGKPWFLPMIQRGYALADALKARGLKG